MDFRQLESFEAVVRLGSFTRAADELFLSQPTVSTHVRRLEAELKTPLIRRTTKDVAVTEKGREVCALAASVLRLQEQIRAVCSPEEKRILRLGASTLPSAYILPEVLPAYGRLRPDTYFVIGQEKSADIVEKLKAGVYDLALVGDYGADPGLTAEVFRRDRLIAIAPVTGEYLSLLSAPDPLRELFTRPVILREESASPRRMDRLMSRLGVDPRSLRVSARVNDPETVKNLVAGGQGFSVVSEMAAGNLIDEKRVLAFPIGGDEFSRDLYAVRRSGADDPDLLGFIRFLRGFYQKREE